MNKPGVKSIAVNAIYLSSARAITSCARAIYAVLLARFLGAELYGLFNYGLSWYILFVPISVLGLDAILVREIGLDRRKSSLLVGQTLALRSISSIVIAVLSCLIGWSVEPDPASRSLLFVFSFALFGRGLSLWGNAVFTAHESSGFVLWQEVIFRLLEVVGGAALLLAGFGVMEVAMVHAGIWLLQGAVGLALIQRYFVKVRMVWDAKVILDFIKQGIPFILGAFLISWLLQGPIIMFRHFTGIGSELGHLALALQAFFILGAIVGELGGAALPVLSRSVARNDGKSDHYIDIVLRSGLLMGGGLTVAAISIGAWLINLIFGPGYEQTARLLPWTMVLVTPYFWMITLQSMIVAHGKYWMIAVNCGLGAIVFTLCFPLLIKYFDLSGVVFSLGAGLLLVVLGQLATLYQFHKISFFQLVTKPLLAVCGAVLVCRLLVQVNIWLSSIAGILSLILFFFLFGAFRKEEIKTCYDFFAEVIEKSH